MAKRDDVFPSKYLKAADLNGDPLVVTIVSAPLETLKNPEGKEQTKTVLYFRGTKKLLPLNVTNWDAVADVTGESDSENWAGCKIELYPATTEMKGKTVACIRIRAPEQPEPARAKQKPSAAGTKRPIKKTDDPDMDDVIPF
jgi:hypothetical protein